MLSRTVARICSVEKVFLKISQNSQENVCARVSPLIKIVQNFKKRTKLMYPKFQKNILFDKKNYQNIEKLSIDIEQ